jgi:hypothetical protein
VLFCALGLLAVPWATSDAATTVSAGTISFVRGPADLDLSGTFPYAVNFSTDDPELIVNGVTFVPDTAPPIGASFIIPQSVTPWQATPQFGTSTDENNLEQIYQDIRWANNAAGERLEAHFNVTPGQTYKIQILVSGNAPENRRWDIEVEGNLSVDEFTSLGLSAPGTMLPPYRNNTSVVFTQQVTATDDSLDVIMGNLGGEDDLGDRNAIWQGITVEQITTSPDDSDADGLPDAWETLHFTNLSQSWDSDPDSDGLNNSAELTLRTIPSNADSDSDGLKDGADVSSGGDPTVADSDGDGLSDGLEVLTHLTNIRLSDTDFDGLTDGSEVNTHGTNPNDTDTDDDDYPDGVEVANGTNPANPASYPLLSSAGRPLVGGDAGEGLDLDGTFPYAFNVGTNGAPGSIRGVTFTDDSAPGITVVAPSQIPGWASFPNLGDSPDDDVLENILWSIRYGPVVSVTLSGLTPGKPYKLQLLFLERCCARACDIYVDDVLKLDDFAPYTFQPSNNGTRGAAAVIGFLAGGTSTTIRLDGSTVTNPVYNDRSPLLCGVTLEAVTGADADGDGLDDLWETANFGNLAQTASGDPDSDGLTNLQENSAGTNPTTSDTDGDGLSDRAELVTHLTDPKKADTDFDGLTDGSEVNTHGTNPNDTDTDDDDYPDGVEVANGTNPANPASYPLLSSAGRPLVGGDAGEGLDLDGTFPYAFNVGTNGAPGSIRGVTFTDDSAPGITVVAPSQIPGWASFPNLGDSPDDDVLENVLWSIRYGPVVSVTLSGLTPGKPYKLQLLFLERCCNRACDIYVDDVLKLDDFAPYTFQPDNNGTRGAAAVIGFLASGTSTTIRLDGTTVTNPLYTDRSPLLCGVTLEAVTGADADGDGLDDLWETSNFGNLEQTATGDPDNDSLTNLQELTAGTNPTTSDTDADGLSDRAELVTHLTDPRKADTDGDGLSDQYEIVTSLSNPLAKDSDSDGYSDRTEVIAGTNPSAAASYPLFSTSIDTFSGGDPGEGLDLTGSFLYAVNIGSNGAPLGPVNGVFFSDDFQPGISVNTINEAANWFAPDFGSTESDDNLEFVMQSMRWSPAPAKPSVDLTGLVPGQAYKLQLLFAESCCAGRAFDIEVEGLVRVDEFNPATAQQGVNNSRQGAVVTLAFVATDDTLNIVLNGQGVYSPANIDHNAIISGLTLETLALADSDTDSLPDAWEIQYFGNLAQSGSADTDADSRSNAAEYLAGTLPNLADSDNDGLSDGAEFALTTNPLLADTDGDDLLDGAESMRSTNPLAADTDGDTFPDAAEIIGGSNPRAAASIPAPAATGVFTGGDAGEGLDLEGSFLYAFNFGTPGAAGPAGSVVFTADNIPGLGYSALNQIPNWQFPDYGGSANDDTLERVMQSIRWAGAPDTVRLQLAGLEPGRRYKLQLLFPETGTARGFDVKVEGGVVADDFFPGNYQGPVTTQGAMVSYEFTAHDSVLRIELDGADTFAPDKNPILAGLTLESLPIIPASLNIVTVTSSGVNFTATGTPGGVYALDYSPALSAGTWSEVNDNVTMNASGSASVTDAIPAHRTPGSGFWRLRNPAVRPNP